MYKIEDSSLSFLLLSIPCSLLMAWSHGLVSSPGVLSREEYDTFFRIFTVDADEVGLGKQPDVSQGAEL